MKHLFSHSLLTILLISVTLADVGVRLEIKGYERDRQLAGKACEGNELLYKALLNEKATCNVENKKVTMDYNACRVSFNWVGQKQGNDDKGNKSPNQVDTKNGQANAVKDVTDDEVRIEYEMVGKSHVLNLTKYDFTGATTKEGMSDLVGIYFEGFKTECAALLNSDSMMSKVETVMGGKFEQVQAEDKSKVNQATVGGVIYTFGKNSKSEAKGKSDKTDKKAASNTETNGENEQKAGWKLTVKYNRFSIEYPILPMNEKDADNVLGSIFKEIKNYVFLLDEYVNNNGSSDERTFKADELNTDAKTTLGKFEPSTGSTIDCTSDGDYFIKCEAKAKDGTIIGTTMLHKASQFSAQALVVMFAASVGKFASITTPPHGFVTIPDLTSVITVKKDK